MSKYLFPILVAIALCSCSSGLSDREALKIAEDTPDFNTAEYLALRINDTQAAVENSSYIVSGVQVRKREESNASIHACPEEFKALSVHDKDGNVITLGGYFFSGRYSGMCAGCEYCYKAFQDKGLLKLTWEDEQPSDLGLRKVKITLTDEGQKYLLQADGETNGNDIASQLLYANTGDAVMVKLMQRVYTGATKVWEDEDKAEFYLKYYYELTPFGEALYGPERTTPGYQTKAVYDKDMDGKWHLSSLEDIAQNSNERKFSRSSED